MELTQEYFDKGISHIMDKLASEIGRLEKNIDFLGKSMVTKDHLKESLEVQTQELQVYTEQSFETQQVWMDERFGELVVDYDVRERVEHLENGMSAIKRNNR